ncbi:hypothetical protein Slin14017_G098440 [Septoria linicola]|nr:hypothetical protein Slin14017_G098440 [Septoria linicola]
MPPQTTGARTVNGTQPFAPTSRLLNTPQQRSPSVILQTSNPDLHLNVRQKLALTSPRLRGLLLHCIEQWKHCANERQIRLQRARHFIRHWHYIVFLRWAQLECDTEIKLQQLTRAGRRFFASMSEPTLVSWERRLIRDRDHEVASPEDSATPAKIVTHSTTWLPWQVAVNMAAALAAHSYSIGRYSADSRPLWYMRFSESDPHQEQVYFEIMLERSSPVARINALDEQKGIEQDHRVDTTGLWLPAAKVLKQSGIGQLRGQGPIGIVSRIVSVPTLPDTVREIQLGSGSSTSVVSDMTEMSEGGMFVTKGLVNKFEACEY